MRHFRLHRHIWLAWGRWWAIQWAPAEWLQLGFHAEPKRPLLDLFLGPLTVALGRHPVLTDPRYKHRHSGRGFLIPGHFPEDLPL